MCVWADGLVGRWVAGGLAGSAGGSEGGWTSGFGLVDQKPD